MVFVRTDKGHRLPLDAVEQDGTWVPLLVQGGNVEPAEGEAYDGSTRVPVVRTLSKAQAEAATLPGVASRWRSHFASCPKAEQFRRRRGGRGSAARRLERDG